jgi:anaerobic glycerol-3-phosphate dehydrogenase
MMKHPYPTGTRVRNHGQQYLEAVQRGTAMVLEAKPQYDGTYEYRVLRDEPLGGNRETWWASYSTYPALSEHLDWLKLGADQ